MKPTSNRLAQILFSLRRKRGWSLDDLAGQTGLSRASLSRLENAEVSPSFDTLGKLCHAFDLPISKLMMMVEDGFTAYVPFQDQTEWEDPETGYARRVVSPAAAHLTIDVSEGHLPPDTQVTTDSTGTEQHLILLDGAMNVTVDGTTYRLTSGDCLRLRAQTALHLQTAKNRGARYLVITA